MSAERLSYIDFWDVGQGDCSVLNFSDQSVVIIDTGPSRNPLIGHLSQLRPIITAIVLTHNDADHTGAVCSIVGEHKQNIRSFYLLQDRPKNDHRFQELFRNALEGEQQGFYKLQRAEDGAEIWKSADGRTRLAIVDPSFSGVILAKSPNKASAIVILEHEKNLLAMWPGDSSLERIANKVSERSLWALVGPHHGSPEDIKDTPEWKKHVDTISPVRAFISVGTFNPYNHPRERYLKELTKLNCRTVCSQITRHCDPQSVQSNSHVLQGAAALGLPSNAKGVHCRGTWRVNFIEGALVPDRWESIHRSRVAKLKRPLCIDQSP